MNPRERALAESSARYHLESKESVRQRAVERFGKRVFSRQVMQEMLPVEVYDNLVRAQEGKAQIRPDYADVIAVAMKEWATGLGATHYCHWFQPLTGATAEKHDSFIEWKSADQVIERFDGKQLVRGEPDASSFPSGGLRSTYEARGYTGWDPSSPAFVWKGGDGIALCIPSVFFSWTGDVLDHKIPLLRSDERLSAAVLRLLRRVGLQAERVYSTVGWEQEYFVIDRALRALRPDLIMLGSTVLGAPAAKGQQLDDHYFGAIKDRILCFMQDFENAALELGIPVKTRHNEVAPAQQEIAPVFEHAARSVDHNILIMELMRQVATEHDLACLLHEKPFAHINGSGKHVNWSLATDTGVNLLDPKNSPKDSLLFLILLTSILVGVHRHGDVLRASVASRSNDYRLGGHEAPPAIISIYLGEALEAILDRLEREGVHQPEAGAKAYQLGIPQMIDLPKDNTDRNRTSPLAFTGSKFEYRAVGSSASCAFPVTVLNLLVAEALSDLLDSIERKMGKESSRESFKAAAIPVLQRALRDARPIRFSGNNYAPEWVEEAAQRGLPMETNATRAALALRDEKAVKLFAGVLSPTELESRYGVLIDTYCKTVVMEGAVLVELFRTQVLPAAFRHLNEMTRGIDLMQRVTDRRFEQMVEGVDRLAEHIERGLGQVDHLDELLSSAESADQESLTALCRSDIPEGCDALRETADWLEMHVADDLWPLPKYREMLHSR